MHMAIPRAEGQSSFGRKRSRRSAREARMTDNESARRAMAGLGGLVRGVGRDVVTGVGRDVVTGVGRDIGQLLRRELESARAELVESGKRAGKGAGLLGGAAVAGELSLFFLSVAAWKGLGNLIGPGRSALVLGTLAGGAGAALAVAGRGELERIQGAPRTVQSLRDLGGAVGGGASGSAPAPRSAPTPGSVSTPGSAPTPGSPPEEPTP